MPNHTVKLLGPIDRLPGVVVVGNHERQENADRILRSQLSLLPHRGHRPRRHARAAIRSCGSSWFRIRCSAFHRSGPRRVELAVAKLGTPEQFYDFHREVYSQRGKTDGPRALEIAHGLGFDQAALIALGDSDEITSTMKNLVSLGTSLGLDATPSFIVGDVAILGYPGRTRCRRSSRPSAPAARSFADAPGTARRIDAVQAGRDAPGSRDGCGRTTSVPRRLSVRAARCGK